MENQHSTQSELHHSFVPSFAPIVREDRMMSPAGNSVHPSPVHPQYLHQPRQQQQQNSLPGTPQHSSAHHSASSSPYHTSFPMNRMNTTDHTSPSSYPHSMPSSRNSSHPASTPSGAYLDPTAYLNMGDVMGMQIESLPMGGGMGNNMDMDLSILSAEEHGDLRILEERERARRLQAHRADHSMAARPDGPGEAKGRGAGRGRKRAESDDSSHDPTPIARGGPGNSSNRKQRGRPRLDTKDENAADRRRTQIRLAQRAYRLRKETTISSLRNRVNELETAIDGMQTTFLELHDSAMTCLSKESGGSTGSFGGNLKQLTEKFLSLAKEALGSSEGAETGDEDAEGESINEEDNANARSKRRRSRDDGSPGSGGMQAGGGGGSVPASYGGYQVSYSRENGNGRGSRSSYDNGNQNRSAGGGSGRSNTMNTNSSFSSNSPRREHEQYSSSSSEGGGYNGGSLQRLSAPSLPPLQYSPDIPQELNAFSYSFHETNFSRRLHRAGLEHAYMMLSSPNADQYEIARIFAYTFCYTSPEDALKAVSKLLQAGTKDSLDPVDYPDILQLPKRSWDYGEMLRKYENEKAGSQLTEPENKGAFDLRGEANKMLIKLGIPQKYLRPDEVEQYIMDLGILTTTDTSVVGSDLMDLEAETRASHQESQSIPPAAMQTRSPSAPPPQNLRTPPQTSNHSPQGGFTSATVMSLEYHQPPVMSALEEQMQYQLAQFQGHTPPAAPHEVDTESSIRVLEGVKKYVDLDVFIKQLVRRGVCLGRFPAFKKSDVETAISLATTQVY